MEETDHGGERLGEMAGGADDGTDCRTAAETVCPEIVNMVLESVEVHDGGLLHFHFFDGTELEIETEE